MDWFVRSFIRSSLAWLALGVTVGVAMAVHPAWTIYRPVHMHMTLLGFVTMMIYGVAYHVVPRFTGRSLWSRWLPAVHVWVSNVGLGVMCVGFVGRVSTSVDQTSVTVVLGIGAALSAAGAYAFALNVWKTIGTDARDIVRASPSLEQVARRG
jgi:cbb3-type cytochrome oxidase subunit 1